MNLYLRLLLVVLAAWRKPFVDLDNLTATLRMRVWPNDIDIAGHMNNGRYLTICDLTRIDLLGRFGLLRVMVRNRWIPLVANHTMTYKKPLSLFSAYDVVMTVERWDDKYFYCKHTFTRGDKIIAEGTSVSVIRGKDGVIPPEVLLAGVRRLAPQ